MFKIGDRVIYNGITDKGVAKGEHGVIITIDETAIGVVFERFNPCRHDLGAAVHCKDGHGWWCDIDELTIDYAENHTDRFTAKEFIGQLFDDFISKEKNTMIFTFNTTDGERYISEGKHNGKVIPTITTKVSIGSREILKGEATCDKADYNERQGILEAMANALCNGNFDREYKKIIQQKKFEDKKERTCTYCGKLCDSIDDKKQHEQWHIERRKARHERYLLRKRAKEIAFEEKAWSLAKELMSDDK